MHYFFDGVHQFQQRMGSCVEAEVVIRGSALVNFCGHSALDAYLDTGLDLTHYFHYFDQ